MLDSLTLYNGLSSTSLDVVRKSCGQVPGHHLLVHGQSSEELRIEGALVGHEAAHCERSPHQEAHCGCPSAHTPILCEHSSCFGRNCHFKIVHLQLGVQSGIDRPDCIKQVHTSLAWVAEANMERSPTSLAPQAWPGPCGLLVVYAQPHLGECNGHERSSRIRSFKSGRSLASIHPLPNVMRAA